MSELTYNGIIIMLMLSGAVPELLLKPCVLDVSSVEYICYGKYEFLVNMHN